MSPAPTYNMGEKIGAEMVCLLLISIDYVLHSNKFSLPLPILSITSCIAEDSALNGTVVPSASNIISVPTVLG